MYVHVRHTKPCMHHAFTYRAKRITTACTFNLQERVFTAIRYPYHKRTSLWTKWRNSIVCVQYSMVYIICNEHCVIGYGCCVYCCVYSTVDTLLLKVKKMSVVCLQSDIILTREFSQHEFPNNLVSTVSEKVTYLIIIKID